MIPSRYLKIHFLTHLTKIYLLFTVFDLLFQLLFITLIYKSSFRKRHALQRNGPKLNFKKILKSSNSLIPFSMRRNKYTVPKPHRNVNTEATKILLSLERGSFKSIHSVLLQFPHKFTPGCFHFVNGLV